MKILFVEPYESSLFCFRKELLDALIADGHDIVLCITETKKVTDQYFKKTKIIDVPIDLKNKGLFSNVKLKRTYKRIIKQEKPDLVLSFTIKPNIYCGMAAKKTPIIANITGLGNMFKSRGLLYYLGVFLYKISFKNVDWVFFQNNDCLSFFKNNRIHVSRYKIIPGSGVNTEKFKPLDTRKDTGVRNFLFASRPLKEKGFDLLVESIPEVVKINKNVHFNFLCSEDEFMQRDLAKRVFEENGSYITILGRTDNMRMVYCQNDFLVSPSFYREGISNVLLESLACERPIITTDDNPGCLETLAEGKNGLGTKSNDLKSLIFALNKAATMSNDEVEKMGKNGREFVIQQFSRDFVLKEYLDVIKGMKNAKEK